MQHVLILTKNALSEESLIRQLHYLNYEVLCSTDLLQYLQRGKNSAVFSYFQAVILSETLSNGTIEALRESISQAVLEVSQQVPNNNQILAFPMSGEGTELTMIEKVRKSFSKKEKKVFQKLWEAQVSDGVVSRKEICDYLWPDGETPSNMSQLSCLINKIKRKFEREGITDEVIVTLWGRGYKLNEKFCERWLSEESSIIDFPQSLIN